MKTIIKMMLLICYCETSMAYNFQVKSIPERSEPLGSTIYNCSFISQNTQDDPGQLLVFSKTNVLNSPITQFDSISNAISSLRYDMTYARALSFIRGLSDNLKDYSVSSVRNVTTMMSQVDMDYQYVYDNRLASHKVYNNTVWRNSMYEISYKVTACIDTYINNPCRWVAPLVCYENNSQGNNYMGSNIGGKTIKCAPMLVELEDGNSAHYSTAVQQAKDLNNLHGKFKISNWTSYPGVLTNPTGSVGSTVSGDSVLLFRSDSSVSSLRYNDNMILCDLNALWYLTPIESATLQESTPTCIGISGSFNIMALPNTAPILIAQTNEVPYNTVPCQSVSSYISFSSFTPVPVPVITVKFPPYSTEYFNIYNNSYPLWRPITKIKFNVDGQQTIAEEFVGLENFRVLIILYSTCVNDCAESVIQSTDLATLVASSDVVAGTSVCDFICYGSLRYANTLSIDSMNDITNLTTCDIHSIQNEILTNDLSISAGYKFLFNSTTYNAINYTVIEESCDNMAFYIASSKANVGDIYYDPSSLRTDNITTNVPRLLTQTSEDIYAGDQDDRLCAEPLFSRDYFINYEYLVNNRSVGTYSGNACSYWDNSIVTNNTLAEPLKELLSRSTEDKSLSSGNKQSDSQIISQWLLLAQNAVLSIIASIGLLSVGQLATRLDSLLYSLIHHSSKLGIKTNSANVVILIVMWTLIIIAVIITNVASVANLILTIVRLSNVDNYTAYDIGVVNSVGGSIMYESVQVGIHSTKIWPGIVIMTVYGILLLLLAFRMLYVMFSTNWHERSKWLHESSYAKYKGNALMNVHVVP